jgi:hypothetical protein
MNLYQLRQYIKYKWNAKSRHGIHSPFVYRFVDECLNRKITSTKYEILTGPATELVNKIIPYFSITEVLLFNKEQTIALKVNDSKHGRALLVTDDPDLPGRSRNTETIILIPGIHQSAEINERWNKACRNPEVRLSLDLFHVGLLFSREEFKEKQHFILKWK